MTGNPYNPNDPQPSPEEPHGGEGHGTPYGPPPYQQPYSPYQQPYGQPYPQPYGTGPYGGLPPQKDSSATTAMVLGIVSVAGTFFCGITAVLGPFALVMGLNAKRRIDASGGALTGRGEAQAGFVLGIIGTVLLVLGILAIVVVIVVAVASDHSSSTTYPQFHTNALAAGAGAPA